ncbi:MAG: 2-amino-4-hydroxy-6-hydroxymethyldihydropteridine diphosphokinase [Armatimonadota bacterium]
MACQSPETCYLGLGSNVGSPRRQLAEALADIATSDGLTLLRVSPVYRTTPVGYENQPDFLNIVIAVRCSRTPEKLLQIIHHIERRQKRRRPFPNAPRTIDIDILLCEDSTRSDPELTIPHPRMRQRQFVLVPLHHIAPNLRLPDGTPVEGIVHRDCRDVTQIGRLAQISDM